MTFGMDWSSARRAMTDLVKRRISGVQRSANASAPRATGQNWP
jgi:hypothetical protein